MAHQLNHHPSIEDAVDAVRNSSIPEHELDKYLDVLQDYECWEPLFRLISKKLKLGSSSRENGDYIRLASIYAKYLEDIPKLAEVCRDLVKNQKMTYEDFKTKVLADILLDDEFEKESIILEKIKSALLSKEEQVACTERLCLIYEKKKYDEASLNRNYEALIKLDPNNLKALRYFKAVYTQNQAWEEVVDILKKLYQSSKHVNDGYRIAQELATVFLFQLDMPEEAISVIERCCADSPLDTSSVIYEAFFRLKNWEGCLNVLKEFLPRSDSDHDTAVIYLKMGELLELLGRKESALSAYQASHEAQPSLLESLENMIEMQVSEGNWRDVAELLKKMMSIVTESHQKDRIAEAISRLEGGLKT